MILNFARNFRLAAISLAVPVLAFGAAPAFAQMETVDPDVIIDGDLHDEASGEISSDPSNSSYDYDDPGERYETQEARPSIDLPPENPTYDSATVDTTPAADQSPTTYGEDDLIGAAEGLFGQGAEGLARLIQDILSDQGEPNAYIVGREGGGAFVVGVRYGSGTMYHAVEGNMPVYWTGPSIGLDAGANAGNTFVLVYNLHDTDELYERYPAGEGQAYLVGGFHASYVRKGDVVMIPIRVGAGLRLGVNAGYMRFSREQRWLPF
ncbi:hypothetical protein CP97_13450 [Aurantiacibacter atlanticus]|uniref:DUF1134 domain-containing protein n=1 Tax=Aurantiacibacter atlanticus TaxID=1648404 RepID=A0A0H4W033_9SPHN|nr:DUF1134 domain-containing protein [Aurantiacibacter atlanticus]AKQ42818.1 hypothetical protein CP97_13450 [Aurantiacibacter atlanticus]MDF1835956.1 DUF1134 domain-containing protein [Alteraurantiacibacter sp. bin_em_oilr2.035]